MFLIACVSSRETEGCVFGARDKKGRVVRESARASERERERVERQLFT